MNQIRRSIASIAAIVVTAALPALLHAQGGSTGTPATGPSVGYHVAVDVRGESFRVTADLRNIPGDTITYYFPIWGPGAYDIVNFGGYVHDFTATGKGGRKLAVLRTDTNTFRIIGGGGEMHLAYVVHDIERTPSSLWFGLSDIERDYAFANTPAIFGYPDHYKDIPHTVAYAVPKGWQIAIGLDPAGAAGSYRARDYDELVDAPLVMGKFQKVEFTVKGIPHTIALFAPERVPAAALAELADTTRRIVETVSGFFGDMPYKRYMFQIFLARPSMDDIMFGALEHRNSSTYRMPWFGDAIAATMAGVLAHEYWHAWSPKRIHVASLGPFDYQRPPHTASLWFAEGLTEYYAKVLLTRRGTTGSDELIDFLNQTVSAFAGKTQRQSMTELSLHIAEVKPEQALALYSKGPVLGLLLDAEIRLQTGNRKSLDDAMRAFNEEFGKTGKTFTDEDIIPVMERVTGARLADFFGRYINGHDSIPFAAYLPKMGFAVRTTFTDKVTFGATFEAVSNGWQVKEVTADGSAAAMGLKAGDVVAEVKSGTRAIPLAKIPVGAANSFAGTAALTSATVIRGGERLDVPMKFVKSSVPTMTVAVDDDAAPAARDLRRSMFGF